MNTKNQNITQDPVIIQFRYAGYYQDKAKFDQLYARHRIDYDKAFNAYMFGRKIRKNRIDCGVEL